MLSLQSKTPDSWLRQVEEHLDEVLIDHAHCEKKAAGTALGLFTAYVENQELCRDMTVIVNEELDHFHQVIAILDRRGIRFRRQKPSQYGRRMVDLVRKHEPDRAVDRLLVASLIEARSCERFDLLRKRMQDRELADFYDSLFECEARHHARYVRVAKTFAPEAVVQARLRELAIEEARIIALGDDKVRMHS